MTFLVIWSASEDVSRGGVRCLTERFARPITRVDYHDEGRLAFCELARSSRVMADHGGRDAFDVRAGCSTAVVGEIRLDRRDELCRVLGAPHDASGLTDEALLGLAYRERGQNCAVPLWGEYAFAIWDPLRKRVFAARDPSGSVPLYYGRFREGMVLTPDIAALLTLPFVSRRADQRAVLDCLGEFPEDEEATEYAEIRRLPPGHCLVAESLSMKVRQYYFLDAGKELRLSSDAEYAAELRSTLQRAVRIRIPQGSNCAVMLSGGLDSSFIAALASDYVRETSGNAIGSVAAVFDEFPKSDERTYQREIVKSARALHVEVRPNPGGAAGEWGRAISVLSQPSFIGPHWLAWEVAQAVTPSQGVVLTGIDGDRVIWHGQGRLAELSSAGRWRELFRETLALPNRTRLAGGLRFLGHAARGFLPSWTGRLADGIRRPGLVDHELALEMLRQDRLVEHSVRERLCSQPRAFSAREAHWRALNAPDRAKDVELLYALGSSFGREFRHPFYDRHVVELCLALPSAQKLRGGKSRFVLRGAMEGKVPEAIRHRREKAYFDAPYFAWLRSALRRGSQGRPINFENLGDYVNPSAVRGLLADVLAGRNAPVDFVWRCTIVAAWLELLERRPVRSGAI